MSFQTGFGIFHACRFVTVHNSVWERFLTAVFEDAPLFVNIGPKWALFFFLDWYNEIIGRLVSPRIYEKKTQNRGLFERGTALK